LQEIRTKPIVPIMKTLLPKKQTRLFGRKHQRYLASMQYKKRLPELAIIRFFETITTQNTLIKWNSGGIQLGIQASFTFNTSSNEWWRFTPMVSNRVAAVP